MPDPKPIAISCGDPAGIGPEIAAQAWRMIGADIPLLWLGDPAHLPEGTPWAAVTAPRDAIKASPDALPVWQMDFGAGAVPGQPDPRHAPHIVAAIERAVKLVQAGDCAALCTAPIHKQALAEGAGFAFPGHTEFLAHLAGGTDVAMMLASDQLRVVPATIHIALRDVPTALTRTGLERVIRLTHATLVRDFALPRPRIAVAGLNPHAGEGGRMGNEELRFIAPLLDDLRAEGFDLQGPLPADTMFHAAARARYDAAICMYHDQALIPIKTLDFDRGVNLTMGLPFVRTSPDHGTAFDIAGQGIANPSSMIEALRLAHSLTERRKDHHGQN